MTKDIDDNIEYLSERRNRNHQRSDIVKDQAYRIRRRSGYPSCKSDSINEHAYIITFPGKVTQPWYTEHPLNIGHRVVVWKGVDGQHTKVVFEVTKIEHWFHIGDDDTTGTGVFVSTKEVDDV